MFLAKSFKKTRIINRIVKLMNTSITDFKAKNSNLGMFEAVQKKAEMLDEEFDELFNCMMSMDGLNVVLQKHNTSGKELNQISSRILCAGYGFQGKDFLPVALVSFGNTLDYILTNKNEILNYSNDEIKKVVEVARKML